MKPAWLALPLLLAGCAQRLPPTAFAGSGPAFDPVAFFTGHVTSWGVEENRAGAPTAIVVTDCTGTASGPGAIRMVQVLHVGHAKPLVRVWQLRQTNTGAYIATANDMVGEADADISGRVLHWHWVWRANPNNSLADVTLTQWMYRMDDGAVVIRTVVTKLGIRLAEVTEQFEKQPR